MSGPGIGGTRGRERMAETPSAPVVDPIEIESAGTVAMTGEVSLPVPTSPAEIILMLQLRLKDLDTQIRSITAGLNNAGSAAEALARQIQERRELLQYCRGMVTEPDGNIRWSQFDDDDDHLTGGEATFGDDGYDNQIMALEHGLIERLENLGIETSTFNLNRLQDELDDLDSRLQQVNSGNESMMVSLQSITQQRTSAIQMATNMLRALDESMDSIVGNLR